MDSLNEKIELLQDYGMPEKEIAKVKSRFMPALGLTSYDELKAMLDYLKEKNIKIKNARHVKDLVNEISKVRGGVTLLEEVNAVSIYEQNPKYLSYSAFEISRRINYCKFNNIVYQNEDGTYKDFIFNEKEFNQELESHRKVEKEETPLTDNDFKFEPVSDEDIKFVEPVDFTPSVEDVTPTFNGFDNIEPTEPDSFKELISSELSEDKPKDDFTSDIDDLEAKTTDFDALKKELAEYGEGLEKSTDDLDNLISFNDYNFDNDEGYGRRRAA